MQTVPRAVNTQSSFVGLRESLAPCPSVRLSISSPTASPRGALPKCQYRLCRWGSASQPWVSAVRQARAWRGWGGRGGGPGATVLSDCLQNLAKASGEAPWASSAVHRSSQPFRITGPPPRAPQSHSMTYGGVPVRTQGEFQYRQDWPCRIRGDSPKEQSVSDKWRGGGQRELQAWRRV